MKDYSKEVPQDTPLTEWLRYYGWLIVLLIVGAGGAGLLYLQLSGPRHEAWSIFVESTGLVSPRQLDSISSVLFRSASVYQPAMDRLGIERSPEAFLDETVGLRPIPDSRGLIVVGKGPTEVEARRASATMTHFFLETLSARFDRAKFTVVGNPQPATVTDRIPVRLGVLVSAVVGLTVGFALSLLHYRLKRPVLTLERAVEISGAKTLTIVRGRGPAWLGLFRPNVTPENILYAKSKGAKDRFQEREPYSGDETAFRVLAHAGTSEKELRPFHSARYGEGINLPLSEADLIWIR